MPPRRERDRRRLGVRMTTPDEQAATASNSSNSTSASSMDSASQPAVATLRDENGASNRDQDAAATDTSGLPQPPHSPPLYGPHWGSISFRPASPPQIALPPAGNEDADADADADADDDDYRSETSCSESNSRDSANGGGHTPKNIASSYCNHRDLSTRLKRAIRCADSASAPNGGLVPDSPAAAVRTPTFDADLIGADVVLCVKSWPKRTRVVRSATPPPACSPSASPRDVRPARRPVVIDEQDAADAVVVRFYAHRFMLAASSEPFRAMLTGNMRESTEREVEIHGVEPEVLEKMLVYIYTGEVTVDLQTVVGLLIASEMYELDGLREICRGFVLVHAQDVLRDPQMVLIPEKVLLEIVESDDLQIRENTLLDALVMWGESRLAQSDKSILDILSDVMEHVRFPTMSVSDLYGKVRPLVSEGVIRPALLTEALFHHLKWGTQSGSATQRAKPRAGAAALRKRKRVSFIQHVSFVAES
ncbi:hypothetical protein P43SY_002433 [Pythium insidiosum]|uniref:BTB domain-containing protein n=1 Tax=Pythium insidiosum TaxID=114742 RepID=A0AAD5LXD0_PYTIN|nr:hypothetical protein P43SY_002433 [Pythium insidiosum]